MAVVEDIELRVTVNGTAAQKGLDDTRKAAESMGGRIGSLGEAMKGFQQKLGPAAAAISGVSTALGQTNGEAGKALAAIGQVAAAFAAGGPFGAALAAGTYAVDALSAAWEKELKAQDDAIQQEYATVSKIFDDIRKLREENAKIERSLMPEAWRQSLERKEALKLIDDEIAKTQARKQVTRDQATAVAQETRALQERREELQKQFGLQDKLAAQRQTELAQREFDRKREEEAARKRAAAEQAARDRAAKSAEESRKLQARIVAGMAKEQEARDRAEAAAVATAGMRASVGFGPSTAAREAPTPSDQVREMNKQAALGAALANDWRLAWVMAGRDVAASMGGAVGAITGAVGIATEGLQQLTTDLVTGQEHAAERFGILIMEQAGQALIGSGTELAGKAVVSAFTPGLQPLAAAQGAAAAGLIASGIGLGGLAAGVGHVMQGGTIGQALPTGGSTSGGGGDMAARARPARPGTAGAGGTNLTIIYGGLSGPSADDGARALGKGLERARRRGIV